LINKLSKLEKKKMKQILEILLKNKNKNQLN